jgi:hypothetical protein
MVVGIMVVGAFIMPEMTAHFFFFYAAPSATSRENEAFCKRLY